MRNDLPTCTGTPETGTNCTHELENPLNTIALPVSDVHGPAVVFAWGGGAITRFFALVCCMLVAGAAWGQTTYTWLPAGGGVWSTSTNWTPTRTTPAANDILVINNGGVKAITGVPTQTIGRLEISGNSDVTLSAGGGTQTLTIGNGTGVDLEVAGGSALTIATTLENVNLAANASADISGTYTNNTDFGLTAAGVSATVSGTFINTGTSGLIPGASAAKLSFAAGSTYEHARTGGTIPTATWATTSTCLLTGLANGDPGGDGQAFGNLTYNCPSMSGNRNMAGSGLSIAGNFQILNIGTAQLRMVQTTVSVGGNFIYSSTSGNLRVGNADNTRTIAVSGDVTITGGTINLADGGAGADGNGVVQVGGNFFHSAGALVDNSTGAGAGIIEFNGGGAQNMTSGGTVTNTVNLVINKAGGAVTLLNDATVNGSSTLTLTSGIVNTGVNSLIVDNSAPGAINGGDLTSYINGNLRRAILAGANNYVYPIGSSTAYAPVSLAFTAGTLAGTLTGSTTDGDHPSIASSTINPSSSVNRYWSFTINSGLATANYDATFNWVGADDDGPFDFNTAIVGKFDAPSTWTFPTVGTVTATSAQVTGESGFSDFQVGNACPEIEADIAGDVTICAGGSANFSVTITGGTGPYTVVYYDGTTEFTVENYTSGDDIEVSPGTTTTYELVSVTDADGCPAATLTGAATVSIAPNPTCEITGPDPTCANASAIYTATNPGGTPTYAWGITGSGTINGDVDMQSATIDAGDPGAFELTLTVSDGACTATCTREVTVYKPVLTLATSSSSTAAVCGDEVTVTVGATSGFTNLLGVQYSVNWDENQLEYQGHVANNAVGDVLFIGPVAPVNNMQYTWAAGGASVSLPDGTVLLTFTFKVVGSSGNAAVSVTGTPFALEVSDENLCEGMIMAQNNVSIALSPISLTFDPLESVCPGTTSVDLIYTATTGAPDEYSIDFDTDAGDVGFVDVPATALPASPISIAIPVDAPCGAYNAILTVLNTLTGCENTYALVVLVGNVQAPTLVGMDDCSSLNSTGQVLCLDAAASFDPTSLIGQVEALYEDDCGDVIVTHSGTTPGIDNDDCSWSFTYEFTIADECGNSTTCEIIYSGGDNQAPELIDLDENCSMLDMSALDQCLSVAAAFDATTLEAAVAALYEDNCGGVSASLTETIAGQDNSNCSWTFTYEFTISDACDNTITCTVNYSGGDMQAPTLIDSGVDCTSLDETDIDQCLSEAAAFEPESLETAVAALYADNCLGTVTATYSTTDEGSSNTDCAWSFTYNFTISDACDRTTTCSVTYTGGDGSAPELTGTLPNGATELDLCFSQIPAGPTEQEIADQYTDCSGVNVVKSGTPVGDDCDWSVTYTYTVTDNCSNTATTVEISYSGGDGSAPTLADISVDCSSLDMDGLNQCLDVADAFDPETLETAVAALYEDNCAAAVTVTYTTTDAGPGNSNCAWTFTYNFTIEDNCENSTTCSVTYSGGDDEDPMLVSPTATCSTLDRGALVQCLAEATAFDATTLIGDVEALYDDNCGSVTATLTNTTPGSNSDCAWSFTYEFVIEDACGNSTICEVTYSGGDTEAPMLLDAGEGCSSLDQSDIDQCLSEASDFNPESLEGAVAALYEDNCLGMVTADYTTTDAGSSNSDCDWTFTYNFEISDACGQTTTCSVTYSGGDGTAPVLTGTLPSGATEQDLCFSEIPLGPTEQEIADQYSDCSGVNVVKSGTPAGDDCSWEVTYTYTVTDNCSNALTAVEITYNGGDGSAPTFTTPADIIGNDGVQCENDNNLTVTGFPTNLTDNCLADEADASSNYTPGTTSWTTAAGYTVSYSDAIEDPHPSNECSLTTNSLYRRKYRITRTFRVEDACGNFTTATQVVNIVDNTPPVLAGCPGDITVECDMVPAPPVIGTDITATDNCDDPGEIVIELDETITPGICSTAYLLTRTWTATDICGYASTCTQEITVQDTQAPTLVDAGVECSSLNMIDLNLCLADAEAFDPNTLESTVAALYEDNCPGTITATYIGTDAPTSNTDCNWTLTYNFEIEDDCENTATCSVTYSGGETEPPTIICPPALTASCDIDEQQPYADLAAFQNAGGSASDNCALNTASLTFGGDVSDGNSCPETVTRFYNISDFCGRVSTCTQTIAIDDEVAPTLNCPPTIINVCSIDDVPPYINFNAFETAGGTADDNCAIDEGSFDLFDEGTDEGSCPETITRTYIIEDLCSNPATCTQVIVVNDIIDPTLTCPPALTAVCNISEMPPYADYAAFETAGGEATDNCGIDESSFTMSGEISNNQSCPETITRTYYIEDDCGNSALCTQTIVVDDEVEPTLTCPQALTAVCNSDEQAVYSNFNDFETAGGSAGDNCSVDEGSFQFLSEVSDGETCPETVTRTYQIADQCGNLATCEQRIVVNDTELPELTCPANLTATCSITEQAAYADLAAFETAGGTADDNCAIDALSFTLFSEISDNNTCPEVVTRTYRIADLCGNTAVCEQTITIDDEVFPELVCPANLTATCSITEQPAYTSLAGFEAANGTADDNCGINENSFELLSEVSDGETCPEVVTRTYQVADLCGNVSSCVQTVTIDDEIDPTLTCPPALTAVCNISEIPPYADYAAFETAGGEATDNCGIDETAFTMSGQTSNSLSCPETIIRTYYIEDDCGNFAICTQTIVVDDEVEPTLTCPAELTAVCDSDEQPAYANFDAFETAGGSAGDNCTIDEGSFQFLSEVSDGETCPETVTRTYQIADQCGNLATCEQRIVVNDTELPELTCPANLTATCSITEQAAYADLAAFETAGGTADDNCAIDALSFTLFSEISDNNTCPEVVTRTYRIADLCGNTAVCEQTITIDDEVFPELVCPANLTATCSITEQPAYTSLAGFEAANGTADDNCGINENSFELLSEVSDGETCPEVVTRTYQVADLCGNVSSCVQTVTINDETPPTAICQNITVELDENTGTVTVPAEDVNNGSSDNCNGQLTFSLSPNTFDCSNLGDNAVELTVTDACDNASTCSATVTVTLENGVTELPTVDLDQSAAVICSGDEYTLEFGGAGNPAGTVYMVTWTIAPTFTSSMPIDENVTLGDDFGPTTGEGMVTTGDPDLTGIIDNINVNSVDITFTVTPKYGPCAGTPAMITVTVRPLPQVLGIDPTPPTAVCSGAEVGPFTVDHNIVAGLNNNQIMWMWSGTDITAAPASGSDTDGSNDLIVTATTLTNTGATAQTATLTIIPKRLNANNLLCEGPAYTIEILVEPQPAISCPDDIAATTDGDNCDTTITLTHPALNYDTDNCPGGSLEISFAAGTPAPAGLPTGGGVSPGGADAFNFENGQTLVTYTVTDGQGNTANCTFTVDVTDNDKPVVTCPDPITVECDEDLTPGPMAPTGEATATDNCPPVAMLTYLDENSPGPGCTQEYVIFRTWTAKDAAGNESSCVQVITVNDSTPPVISCPADVTVDCNTSTLPAATGNAGATDNCSTPDVAYDDEIVDGDCPQEFTIERTWLALDACGNQTTCVQTIAVQDIILPTIACPAAVTVECDDDLTPGDPGQGFPTGFATASDNCDTAPALTHEDSDPFIIPNGCPEDYIIQRTWTVRDACGNETSCVQAIRVQDTTPPVIDVEAEDKTVECDGSGNTADLNDWLANYGGASATDACGDVTWTNDFVALSDDCGATGSVTVTFTATDECDNASVTTATFTIEDTTAPTIDVEASDKTVECDGSGNTTDLNDWLTSNGGAEASDICGGVTWTSDFVELSDDCGATGSVTVTFIATDDCSNAAVTTATFTIEDTTPPTIDTEAADLVVECDGSGNMTELADWLADNGGAEASDACGNVTWSNDFGGVNGDCGATGSVTVTFTAKDDCGNESVTTATLTIEDETPPTIDVEASDETVECDGNGNMTELANWLADNGGAEASDDCGAVSWSNDFEELSDDCGATGSVEVTFAATDACGNTAYTTATFTIEDTTDPSIDVPAADRTVECDGAGNTDALNAWLAANGGAEASDACGGVSWSNDFAGLSDACGATGSVTVTFTATDECDNASVTTATFTIEDTTDPSLDTPASDLTVECDGAGNTTALDAWLASNGGAVATDACSDVTWTYAPNPAELSDDCGETGSVTVTFTAEDDCGNTVQTTATFTIEDTTFPALVCPKDTVINCEVDPIPANTGSATVTDACDPGVMATFSDAGDPAGNCPERTITRTWLAIDACQNTTACEQIITVQDTTRPVIVCPANITVSCEQGTDVTVTGEATATDNCDTDPVILSTDTRTDGNCPNNYTIARRWVAVDNCQNLRVCVQNITVQDITPPTITLCPDPITVECNTSTDPSVTGMAEATDNCSPPPVVESDDEIVPSMDCPQEFQIIRTWTATDACENTATCVQTITVDDSTPPVITCAPNVTVECDEDLTPGAGNPTGIATATDICDTAPVVLLDDEVIISGDCPQEKTIIRTWVALDACSNGTVCIQTITVEDTTPPVLTCPTDFTVECDETPDPVLTGELEQSMIEDNCDEGPFAIDYEDNTSQGNCANGALITRTWMATDACGNTGTCIQQINVEDSELPVITCPADATVECDESTHPDALGSASAMDNCDMNPVITYEDESTQTDDGSCTDYSYTITRTWTATDACGNVSTCMQTIIVEDTTVPTITFCPESTTVECDQPTDPQALGFAQATDNCDNNLTIDFDDESTQTDEGACTDFSYTITRTWTATDACDNATSCIQTITVVDTTDPIILCPEPTTVQCDQPTDPSATGEATATDNCDGNPAITYDDASTQTDDGSCTDFSYSITRTWTAVDACGNDATCIQPIIVVDTQAPVFTVCPPTITVECDLNASNTNTDPANTGVPTAEDNCDPDPTITSSDVEVTTGLQCPVVKQITRTWTVEDACGNSTSDCVQLILVLDNTAPLIECPADITLDCATATDPVNTGGMAIAIDACDATPTIVWEDEQTTGPCINDSLAVITRTWFAFDNCGNVEVCDQFIALIDETAPEFILCPVRDTINCEVDPDPQVTGIPEVVDNCDAAPGVDYSDVSVIDPDCPQGKTITRTWTAVDHCGNMTTCEQIIVVQDTTRPVLICPNDITVQCDESTDPADTGEPLAEDNCDPNVLIANPVDMITPGACPGSFTIKRTWLAADDCDNGTLCMQTITVRDTEPPTWVTQPGDLDKTVDCDDPDALTAAQELFPVAEDNCDDDVTNIEKEEGDFVPGQCPHTGTYTNTWTVTDECGNVSEVFTQVITVQDIVPPTFTVPVDATVYSDGNCEYDASTAVTGDVDDEDDNCATGLEATFSDDIADGDCAGDKIITRTWTLADGCGNVLTQTQVIAVQDTLIPTFPRPDDMTLTTEDGATCPEIASISLTIDQTNPVATGNTAFNYTVHGISIDGPTVYSDNCSEGDDLKLFVWNIFEDWGGTADDCQRQIRILWRVYDDCGNFRQRQQIFTIVDNTAPEFTVPADLSIYCEDNPADLSLTGDVTDEFDNCHTGLEATYSDASTQTDDGSCTDYSYTITRTWTLDDGCGNSLVQTQTIVVEDITSPTLTCPDNITISCEESILPDNTGMATAEDNCDGDPTIDYSDTDNQTNNGTCTDQAYLITRVWTSVDACGNQAQPCTQTIQLIDETAPEITCPDDVTVNCGDDISPAELGEAEATDNCDPEPGVTFTDFTQTAPTMCPEVNVIIRTWLTVDNCNNPAACTQRIAVVDLIAPDIVCPKDTVINCDEDYSLEALGSATATDNCDAEPTVEYLGQTAGPIPCPQGQSILRTWQAEDACGNTAICVQTITVQDTTRPKIVCPADVTVQCDESTDPDENPNMGVPTVSDNCDMDLATSYTETNLGGDDCTQTVLRNWITSDDCNIAAACIQVITITDSEPPVWTFVPESVQLECDGVAPPYEAATAADDCDEDITVTYEGEVSEPGACPGSTVITRTWSTEDDCGNQTSIQQVITIQDSQPPTWTTDPLPADLTLECGETIPDPATLEAEDFCDAEISVEYAEERTDGPCPQAYKLTRTWTAEDDCGNATSHVQVITIEDTAAPELTCPPNDLTLECGNPENADLIATWLASASAEDDCGDATVSNNYDLANFSDGCGETGELAVVFFAVDDCQNQSEPCTRTIRIEDNTAPVLSCPDDLTLECGNPDNAGRIDTWLALATAEDACGDATVSHNFSPTAFSDGCGETGEQTVTFTATDACDNESTPCARTITIVDTTPPTLTCPQTDLTLECGSTANGGLIDAWLAQATAEDACGDATVTTDFDLDQLSDGCGNTGELTVTFQAFDECQNSAEPCTAKIVIEDNTPPALTCPQADLTLECGDAQNADLIAAWLAEATAEDACGDATVNNTYNPDNFSDGCGNTGEQAVVFSAVDDCQNQSQPCTRVIVIEDNTPPVLECPQADLTLECGDPQNGDLIAAWLAAVTATDACGDAAVSHTYSPTAFSDGCGETGEQTVTFQAFDGCQNSSTVCTAKIVIVDNTPPTFTVPDDITLYADADCEVDYSLVGDVTDEADNCSTDLDATFEDEAEPGPGGTERTVFRTWKLTDDCGNMTVLTQTIAIRDTTPPTFVCPQDAVLAPNTDTCTHVIANQDFDPTFPADNCGIEGVGYELSGATFGSGSGSLQGVAFEVGKTTVTWTVKDVNGNAATCTAIIQVSVCATITGTIIWEGNNADTVGVAQATVTLSGDDNQAVGPTPANGDYSITPAGGTNFVLTPSKPGSMTTIPIDPLNGVDGTDATLIRLHIMGFLLITDPYKLIAADVDMDNKITANDEVQIRRALLGSEPALELFELMPWRFVPDTTDTPWSLGYHPAPNPFLLPIPSTRVLTGAGSGANEQNFYGIKKGDVNATADPLLKPAPVDPLVYRVQDEHLLTGKTITVVFRAANFADLITFQHALFADPAYLQLEAVETSGSPLALNPAEHFGLSQAKAGDIRTLWLDTDGHTLADGTPLFALRFRVLQGGRLLSEVLRLHAPSLEPKAYTADFARTSVELEFTEAANIAVDDPATAEKQIELLQNRPNPFTHHTVIGFMLPEACTAQLRILDASGRELLRIDGDYPAGYNEETIQLRDIGAIGILYYELTTPYGKQTRTMKAVGP